MHLIERRLMYKTINVFMFDIIPLIHQVIFSVSQLYNLSARLIICDFEKSNKH